MNALAINSPTAESEALLVREWCDLMTLAGERRNPRALQLALKRAGREAERRVVRGGVAYVVPFAWLPEEWQAVLSPVCEKHAARSFGELLDIRRVETRNAPERAYLTYPEGSRDRASLRKEALKQYWRAIDACRSKGEGEELAAREWKNLTGETVSTRQVRRWVKRVEQYGGPEFANDAAYCDEKSCAHRRARLDYKLGLNDEFKAEWEWRTTQITPMRQAYYSLVQDWLAMRPIPGLGVRQSDAEFPFTFEQLRPFASSNAARLLGTRGKAVALAAGAVRYVHTTTATLRRCEYLLLDDTRIDLIAANDKTGFPVELKAYILMDGASRQILGYIVKESEALMAEDVWALLAQVLTKTGLPVGYPIHIKFERGAVACSDASETLLRSLWPGRIEVHRTSMDKGRNHAGDFWQQPSGHWMGKSHIESFMRTLAFRLGHIAGQRGGDYRRQPAQLGLIGKNRALNLLEYSNGSAIQESARHQITQRLLNWIDTGDLNGERNPKFEVAGEGTEMHDRRLKPVRWVRDAIRESVAFYNAQPSRAEGMATIETQCPNTGKLITRRESPNERAVSLASRNAFVAIQPADAARLLRFRGRSVTVTPQGVTFSCAPWKNLNFYRENSPVIEAVKQLATQQRKLVALVDEDTLRRWNPDTDEWVPCIHLIGDVNADAWRPGMEGRYLDTLPLCGAADRTNPEEMNTALAQARRDLARAQAETLNAARGVLPGQLARVIRETRDLESTVAGEVLTTPHRHEGHAQAAFEEVTVMAAEPGQPGEPISTPEKYASNLPFAAAQDDEC